MWSRLGLLLLLLSCTGWSADTPSPEPPTAWDLATVTATRAGLRLDTPSPELLRARPVPEGTPLTQVAEEAGWLYETRDGVLRIRPRRGLEVEQAAVAMALRDCTRARELLRPDQDPAQALAAATCANAQGAHDDALALIPDAPGPLSPWVRWERARALDGLGRRDEALAALQDVALPGQPGLELRLMRARLSADREALDGLAQTDVGSEARLIRADLSDGDERITALKALWAEARSPWDERAERRLRALGVEVPDIGSDEGRALAQQRAQALDRQYRVQEALELHEALREAQPPTTATDHLDLARARMRGRAYDRAIQSFELALGAPDQATGGARALHDYSLTYARTGDYETSARIYRRLMAQHPDSAHADTGSFKLGYMAYDAGRCDEAIALLQAHRLAHPASAHLDEALWFESRCHWRAGDLDAADAVLSALLRDRPRSSLVAGARYWRARISGLKGDKATEQEALREVLRFHPRTGYGWFAAERLGHRFPARSAASAPPWPATLAELPAVQRAEALLSVGLRAEALAELSQVQASDPEERLALAWALLQAGDARGGQAVVRSLCRSGSPTEQLRQLCTPRPEHALVAEVLADRALHPLLPFGIMNAESALDPSVTSPAGARGLMQLMPEVARALHGQAFAAEPFDLDRLYAGSYNAVLGTWELADRAESLRGALDGDPLPAIAASYNAGEEAVRRWLDAYPGPPEADVFAEDISYTETRRYVKRVLGFVMGLREAYGDP